MKRFFKNQKGFGLLEMLITAVIVALLYFYVIKIYRGKSPAGEQKPEDFEEKVIDASKKAAEQADKKIEDMEKQIEQLNQ